MTALTQDKPTARRDGTSVAYPVAASVTLYAGAMVCLDRHGYAVPAGHASANSPIMGIAQTGIDTQTTAGNATVTLERGVFLFDNDTSNSHKVTPLYIGTTVYALDDQTVTVNSNSNSRKAAGTVLALDNDKKSVWVIIN